MLTLMIVYGNWLSNQFEIVLSLYHALKCYLRRHDTEK